jgi:CheY-like chemotaxis protein/signal transduction histidine kinase/CHASE3 domain sensor protein
MRLLNRKSLLAAAFAAALLIFAAVGWLSYQNMAAARQSDYWQNHTYIVLQQFETLLNGILSAQGSERGFLITGDKEYLEPYHRAVDDIAKTQQSLRNLTKDNPVQQKRLDELDLDIQRKLHELQVTIDAWESKGPAAASSMVEQHLSKNITDEIRRHIANAQKLEKQLLQERTARKEADMASSLRALQVGGVTGFIILLLVYYILTKEISQRSLAEAELLTRNQELESGRDRERAQAWIKNGINELNAKVRGDRRIDEMTADGLSYICHYLSAAVGVMYVHEEESESLRITANYAFTREKTLGHHIKLGEGIAGEAARQKSDLAVRDVPADYLVIGSAFGETPPRILLAIPLLHQNNVVGVMELGLLRELSEPEQEFLKQAATLMGIAINLTQTRQQVNELLLQSQSQEEELRVQQEELQQSNEELEERAQLLEQQREQIQIKNREMEEASREIMRKAEEVEQISRYKSEFLANMSHELRTPLNSLMILSGQLKDNKEGNLTPKQVEYAATIKSAGSQLLNLINDILDLSKIEAGRIEFVYEDTPISEVCAEVAATFKPLAEHKGLEFGISVEEGIGEKIRLDPQRTQQILKNLLSNAIKFTSKGSVRLRIGLADQKLNPLGVPAVAFEVSDTGIGITREKHDLVFQAFQQADGSTSRKYGGTGLGLSISRQLARGMNGEIVLGGETGKGSVFTLYLPLSQPEAREQGGPQAVRPFAGAPPQAADYPAAGRGEAAARGLYAHSSYQPPAPAAPAPLFIADDRDRLSPGARSILIIEDDPDFAKLLMERVRDRGFAAIVATDGNSGIELAERYLPSAILLDVMLPGLDGWGVMQKLTDNLKIRHIPVHFITCQEEKQKALSMGAIGFVTKPVTSEQLDEVFGAVEGAVSRTLRKLLIVEDDETQAAALVALLEERDIAITVAETGAKAIEFLSAEPFDCVVLDLGLSDVSGFDLLEHIRNLEESRRVPVIIHTGQELTLEETQRLQHYAESIIIKGAKSPERLLNEVTLFLHVMESKLPPDKQRMIRTTLDTETLLAGKKVLIVDDDMRNIFSLSSVLLDKGMQIVEAENGKVALQRLEEQPDINVVLMDIMMPEMDGYEATRRIRKDPRFTRLPIIALTAKAMKGDREDCLRAGASDYISKPVDTERLLSLLRVWLYHQG